MSEHTPTDFARLRELAVLLHAAPATVEALDQLAAKSAETRDLTDQHNRARGELVVAQAEHEKRLADLDAAHKVKLARREDALKRQENALEVRERDLESARQKVFERERAVESRSADLSNRLHSVGAA
jgi:hypothetical protein